METAEFVNIIIKWWSIVNTKSTLLYKFKRNDFLKPFEDPLDERITFLESFLIWLDKWRSLENSDSCLTVDTHNALHHSTTVIIKVIKYCLSNISCKYLLTGKFQTDNLESRFGNYRQLSGGNYYVSLRQIYESEKKIRIKGLFNLHSAQYGQIKFNVANLAQLQISDESDKQINISEFVEITEMGSIDTIHHHISDSAIQYIAGYVSFKVSNKLKCACCISAIICEESKEQDEQSYFEILNRGGLTVPSEFVLQVTTYVHNTLQILISESYEAKFLKCGSQKLLLITLVKEYMKINNDKYLFRDFCSCNQPQTKILLNLMLPILANIFINNYVKTRQDSILINEQQDKINKSQGIKCPKKRKISKFK